MSGDGHMSCATCHNPGMGWSDGLPTAHGVKSSVLGRASPTIFNTAYNSIQMWDGSKKSLEDQAMGPMQANVAWAWPHGESANPIRAAMHKSRWQP
jgi:cytochrome c peroxidase